MERFLTAFNRSQQHKRDEEGRSYQFAKKRLSANYSPFDIPTTEKDPGPILHVSDLSSVEKETFVTWWNGLDPFGLGVVQTDVLLSFLIGSKLSQDHLKQILSLYEGELRYTDKQFFAILRLISHAQSGRHVQRDLIAMGAPLPRFTKDSIDVLVSASTNYSGHMNHVQIEPSRTSRESVRNTWWGPIPAPSAPLPHDTFTANMHSRPFGSDPTHGQPVMSPETPLITSSQRASMSSTALPHHPPPDSHVVVNEPSAFIHDNTPAAACTFPTAMSHIDLSSGPSSQNHLDPVAAALTTDENGRPAYAHHGRSRSLPYQTLSIDGLFVDPSPTMTTSRSTTDTPTLHDQGQSLLLTQKFSPPMLRSTLNPFDDNASMDSDDDIHTHQPSSTTPPSNTSCSATDTKEEDRQAIIKDLASIAFANAGASRGRFSPPPHPLSTSQSAKLANTKPNRNLRSPPPVPPQSTKPTTRPRASQPVSQQVGDPAASPSLKRSKSLGESKCPSFMSQGAYLLATSSSSSNVAFPSQPAGDTSRLFRHRSAHAIPHKSND